MIGGVCRKGKRGLPECVLQEEVKGKQQIENAVGTVKVATLSCEETKNHVIIAASVYDTKPVHLLSAVASEVIWVQKLRKLFNKTQRKNMDFKHLRLNLINDYNNEMGDVDRTDQLRGSYRPDVWIRKTKWWMAWLIWCLGNLVVNSF